MAPEIREVCTPQKLANGEVNEQHYVLGWRYREQDIPSVGIMSQANHGGVIHGSQSWPMFMPDHNVSVAVNINRKTKIYWDFCLTSMDIAEAFLRQQDKLRCK
ncbi:hypothetical protein [Microbulbifer variabilis]|uniref:hypothetical protein n=1 Tax=Microbulbifer variabilis TaxID=266805 RepID=UPI001CFC67D3|nr:hypothetical protein [Microbulbifer variabilis]